MRVTRNEAGSYTVEYVARTYRVERVKAWWSVSSGDSRHDAYFTNYATKRLALAAINPWSSHLKAMGYCEKRKIFS